MSKYDLYGGHPPHSDKDTSLDAATSMKPIVDTLQDRVLAYIKSQGSWGAIDDEIEEALGMKHQTASARRRELVLMDPPRIIDSGTRRKTRSGRTAKVWVINTTWLSGLGLEPDAAPAVEVAP